MIVHDANRKAIRLGESVGRGGEATVYQIAGLPGQLAKIYEPEPRLGYAGKLAWMVGHPPENPTGKLNHPSLAWPEGLLFDARRKLIGYQMPHIQHAVPLLDVFNPRRRADILPQFDRRYLLRTAHNLAAALGALHRSGYVAGDLNESNVLVTPAAMVTLIDTDSFQVREERGGKHTVHPCPVGKPEYTPPELQGKSLAEIIRLPDHDAFGLAVLIFQLLMEGSHPFRAQWLAPGDPPPLEVRIANGAYPYVASPAYPVRPPKHALGVETLHPWLSELFRRTFVDGHLDPRWRPGPDLWARALAEAEQSTVCCAEGHFYFSNQKECPYCKVLPKRPQGARAPQDRTRRRWAEPPFRPQPPAAGRPSGQSPAAKAPSAPPAGGPVFRTPNPFAGLFGIAGTGAQAAQFGSGGGGAAVFGAPVAPSRSVLRGRPLFRRGAVSAWVRQRAQKSLLVGGGQGALVGSIPGAMLGLYAWASGEMLAWSLLLGVGGAAGGLLRGWLPGQKLAALIDRYVGWKFFWESLGLLVGMVAGGLLTLPFLMMVFPVLLGLILGAQTGRYLGGKIWRLGNFAGWERLWGVVSALGFAGMGFGLSRLLGLLGVNAFGASLASGLLPFAANDSFFWAIIWTLAGAVGGALSGWLAGFFADLAGRVSGLVN
jgi:hypothetical protein